MARYMCGFRTTDPTFWNTVKEHTERFPEIQPFLPTKIRKFRTKKECLAQIGCPMVNCRDCKIPDHLKKYQWVYSDPQEFNLIKKAHKQSLIEEDIVLWKEKKNEDTF